jgi:hypothetical protein
MKNQPVVAQEASETYGKPRQTDSVPKFRIQDGDNAKSSGLRFVNSDTVTKL